MNFGPSFLDFEEDRPDNKNNPSNHNSSNQPSNTNSNDFSQVNGAENDSDNSAGENYDFTLDNYIQDPESFLNYQGIQYPQDDIDTLLNNNIPPNINQSVESPNSPSSSIVTNDPNYVYYNQNKLTVPIVSGQSINTSVPDPVKKKPGRPKLNKKKVEDSTKKKEKKTNKTDKDATDSTNTKEDQDEQHDKRKPGRPKLSAEEKKRRRKQRKLEKERSMQSEDQSQNSQEKNETNSELELQKTINHSEDKTTEIEKPNIIHQDENHTKEFENQSEMNQKGVKTKDFEKQKIYNQEVHISEDEYQSSDYESEQNIENEIPQNMTQPPISTNDNQENAEFHSQPPPNHYHHNLQNHHKPPNQPIKQIHKKHINLCQEVTAVSPIPLNEEPSYIEVTPTPLPPTPNNIHHNDIIPPTPSHHLQKQPFVSYEPNESRQIHQHHPLYQNHNQFSYVEQNFDKPLPQDQNYSSNPPPINRPLQSFSPSSPYIQNDINPFEPRQPQTDRDYFAPATQFSNNFPEQQFKPQNNLNYIRAAQQTSNQQKQQPVYQQQQVYQPPPPVQPPPNSQRFIPQRQIRQQPIQPPPSIQQPPPTIQPPPVQQLPPITQQPIQQSMYQPHPVQQLPQTPQQSIQPPPFRQPPYQPQSQFLRHPIQQQIEQQPIRPQHTAQQAPPSYHHMPPSKSQDDFHTQIDFLNKLQQSIEEKVVSKLIKEPPFFTAAMENNELILNPFQLGFEPEPFWYEHNEDFTFRQLVLQFFRTKTRVSRFIYKLYDMLLITSKIPFFKAIVGVNWVTFKIFSVNVECISAMLSVAASSIDQTFFAKNGLFPSLGFIEITPENYIEAGLASFPDISEPNIKLFFHRPQLFVNKPLSIGILDEIDSQLEAKKIYQQNNIQRSKYPAFSS